MKPEPDNRQTELHLCGFGCPYLTDTMSCLFYQEVLEQLDDGPARCAECLEP